MAGSKRMQIRPVAQTSILEKKFNRVVDPSKRVHRSHIKVHALMVLADLRRGSLATLDRYLAQEGGIPDRNVAIELRKLISGSMQRTGFRLLVIEHPDKPKNKGGRPTKRKVPSAQDRQMDARSKELLPAERGKTYLSRQRVAEQYGRSDSTVKRAIRRVGEEAEQQQESDRIRKRRLEALEKLRNRSKEPSS